MIMVSKFELVVGYGGGSSASKNDLVGHFFKFRFHSSKVSSGKSMDAIEAELESELAAIGNVVAHYDASLAEAESIRLTTRRHLMPM